MHACNSSSPNPLNYKSSNFLHVLFTPPTPRLAFYMHVYSRFVSKLTLSCMSKKTAGSSTFLNYIRSAVKPYPLTVFRSNQFQLTSPSLH